MKQILVLALAAMALVAVAPRSARAGMIIAQQEQDFQPNFNGHPDTIGSGTWTYMYSDNINPSLGATGLLTWNGTYSEYDVASADWYPDVAKLNARVTMAPEASGAAATLYGVMRWTSGVSGSLNVSGTWTPFWAASWGGTGMDVAVYADSVLKFTATLMPTDTAGLDFDFDINAFPGSIVDYVVGPGSLNNGSFDRAYIETTIVPIPGAVLLGLLGLSAAGIRLRRFA